MASGKGISSAVRDCISTWISTEVVDKMYEVYSDQGGILTKGTFYARSRKSENWIRKNRSSAALGWKRVYVNKVFKTNQPELEVHTNSDDTKITYVTIKIDGELVSGGKVSVPSVLVGGTKKAKIQQDPKYVPFTKEELKKIHSQPVSNLDTMFEERLF